MSIDILIFAVIAALLVHRLRSVLGQKHGEERQRPNPFSNNKDSKLEKADDKPNVVPMHPDMPLPINNKNLESNKTKILESKSANDASRDGLIDIVEDNPDFDIDEFINGASMAFKMVVQAYASGNREVLKPLLSEKLFKDFDGGIKAREDANQSMEFHLERIKKSEIIKANLAGRMIYITVDFDVEKTSILRDSEGNVLDGDPDLLTNVHDIWVFAKDAITNDANWMLIETSTSD